MLLGANDKTILDIIRNNIDLKEIIILLLSTLSDLFYMIFHTNMSHWTAKKKNEGTILQSRVTRKMNYKEMAEENIYVFYNIDWDGIGLEYARSSKNGRRSYPYFQSIRWVNLNHTEGREKGKMVGQFWISLRFLEEFMWKEKLFRNFKKIFAR